MPLARRPHASRGEAEVSDGSKEGRELVCCRNHVGYVTSRHATPRHIMPRVQREEKESIVNSMPAPAPEILEAWRRWGRGFVRITRHRALNERWEKEYPLTRSLGKAAPSRSSKLERETRRETLSRMMTRTQPFSTPAPPFCPPSGWMEGPSFLYKN